MLISNMQSSDIGVLLLLYTSRYFLSYKRIVEAKECPQNILVVRISFISFALKLTLSNGSQGIPQTTKNV